MILVTGATGKVGSEGLQVVQRGARRGIDSHWQRGLSSLKIGLRAVQYALSQGQAVFTRLTLQGGPDPEPLGTRKRSRPTPLTTLEVGWKLVFRPPS